MLAVSTSQSMLVSRARAPSTGPATPTAAASGVSGRAVSRSNVFRISTKLWNA
jgi:hypothetical protein